MCNAWLGDFDKPRDGVRDVLHVRDFIQRAQHERLVPLDRADDEPFRVRDMTGCMDKPHGLALLTNEGFKETRNGDPVPAVHIEQSPTEELCENDGERLKSRHRASVGERQRFFSCAALHPGIRIVYLGAGRGQRHERA